MANWESISPPRGSFVGWGSEIGQNVTGKVISIGTGKDVNGLEVPEIAVELTSDGRSFAKGQWTELETGTTAIITCGLSNLKKNITAADLHIGDLISITLESLYPTAKSPAKIFDVRVARGEAVKEDPWSTSAPSFAGFGDSPTELAAKPPF